MYNTIDNFSTAERSAFLDDLAGIDGELARLRRLPLDQLLDEAMSTIGTTVLPSNEVWQRATAVSGENDWQTPARLALESGLPVLGMFQFLAMRPYPATMKMDMLRWILNTAPRHAMEAAVLPSRAVPSHPIPVWLHGYNLLAGRRSLKDWTRYLSTFAEAGYTVPTSVLVTNALEEDATADYWIQPVLCVVRHMLTRQPDEDGQHLVEALLDHAIAGRILSDLDHTLDQVMQEVQNVPGQAQHVRLLLDRGLVITDSHLQRSCVDMLGFLVEQGPIHHLVGDSRWFVRWLQHEPDRAQRLLTLVEKCRADDLNAAVDQHRYPFPMWAIIISAGSDLDLEHPAQEAIFQAALASGADVTREGIARHFPDEEKAEAVEECFLLDRVRVHVERAELRKAAEQAMAEAELERSYVRRRL